MRTSLLKDLFILAFPLTVALRVEAAPTGILFIGNSLTYRQKGIYFHLEKLAASAVPAAPLQTEKAVKGGASLRTLGEQPEPRERIAKDADAILVLQEDIPETTVASFREQARKFLTEIRAAKARPVLLMAWSCPRLGWISPEEIDRAHRDAARELGVEVAPVGLARRRSIAVRAGPDLYAADRELPGIAGTCLATCVV